ncbi:CYIR protein [Plasmodium cynomolgi strain B]|uniref:CYIR protein n=1 Tax=Plasmodium cynomolgi (strain B) TaxID=1120755 RepID=K6UZK6_PLACD|nr:CYIR protein [Plasmodium cynomolgi strain B]GAB69424.1 CYIR protein [Plasmodium cynomolgi strain B]
MFNNVSLYLFYEDLKNDASTNEYSDYYNKINNLTGNHSWIGDLFNKLCRNISMINNKHDIKDEFDKKHCFDLNYWLYDQVYTNLQLSKNFGELRTIVSKVQEVWKNIVDNTFRNKDYKCNPDQKLYNFDIIKKEIIADTLNSCYEYREYLTQRIAIYYTWRYSCRVDGSTCKRFIDNYMKYRPSGIILSLGWTIYFTYNNYPCYEEVHDIFGAAKRFTLRDENLHTDFMEKHSSLNSDKIYSQLEQTLWQVYLVFFEQCEMRSISYLRLLCQLCFLHLAHSFLFT